MNRRYAALALAVALVVPGAAVTAASASALSGSSLVQSDRGDGPMQDRGDKKAKGSKADKREKSKKTKKVKAKTIVYNGTVGVVDAGAGTLTVKVRGGRDKQVRKNGLTLTVPEHVKITRNGKRVALADLKAGDRVNVQTRQAAKVITVVRVTAKGVKAVPTPDPTESTEPMPVETTDPEETPEPDVTAPDGSDGSDDSGDFDDAGDSEDDSIPVPSPTA